MINCWE